MIKKWEFIKCRKRANDDLLFRQEPSFMVFTDIIIVVSLKRDRTKQKGGKKGNEQRARRAAAE